MNALSTHDKLVISNVSRRGLLKGIAATGGLVLAAQFPAVRGAHAAYPTGAASMPNGVVSNPKIFVSIGNDGIVSIVAARAEMGNGAARTALPMIVADEMEADWERVRVVQSPGDEKTYGNQDTDGSRSVRHFIQPMRACGAAARQMLETAAAKQAGGRRRRGRGAGRTRSCTSRSGRKLGYGELAADAAVLPVPAEDKITAQGSERLPLHGQGQRPHQSISSTSRTARRCTDRTSCYPA